MQSARFEVAFCIQVISLAAAWISGNGSEIPIFLDFPGGSLARIGTHFPSIEAGTVVEDYGIGRRGFPHCRRNTLDFLQFKLHQLSGDGNPRAFADAVAEGGFPIA